MGKQKSKRFLGKDTIRFEVITVSNNNYEEEYEYYIENKDEEGLYDHPEKEFVYTELYLNDEKYGYHISEYSLIRTKKQIDCYTGWNGEVWYPDHSHSLFEPFTCSCGVSGCAGIWDGVHMKVRARSVEWRMGKDTGYDFLPKRFFQFDKQEYFKAINKLEKDLEDK